MGGTIDGRHGDHVIVAPPYIATAVRHRHDRRSARRRGGRGPAQTKTALRSICIVSLRHLTAKRPAAKVRAMRNFSDLTEREVLALAIANEEEDGRIYTDIAEGLRAGLPG